MLMVGHTINRSVPVKLKAIDEPGVLEDTVSVRQDSALLLSELALQASTGEYSTRESDGLMSIKETTGLFDVEVELELCEEEEEDEDEVDDDDDAVVDCDTVVEFANCVLVTPEVVLEELESVREDDAEGVEGTASLASYWTVSTTNKEFAPTETALKVCCPGERPPISSSVMA